MCVLQNENAIPCKGWLKYPNGIFGTARCQAHDTTARGTLADEDVCGLCGWTPSEDPPIDQDERIPGRICNICRGGEATWAHWIDYCPVFQATFAKLEMPNGFDTINTTEDKVEFALACQIVAEMKFFIH